MRVGALNSVNKVNWLVIDQIMPVFGWSIFISAVIDHMICYNLNWPKIKF